MRTARLFVFLSMVMAGCAALRPVYAPDYLAQGLQAYDRGEFAQAERLLLEGIQSGRLNRPDQAEAYKFLAFVYCTSDRLDPCKKAFRHALELQPQLELAAAEAGHPVWGPVFRGVKAEFAAQPASR
jgi:tetratricopeptide (TPR) repeat protein